MRAAEVITPEPGRPTSGSGSTWTGAGRWKSRTGVGFFDHMLTALGAHAGFDLLVQVQGDLNVDCHHTIEDTGIVLGQALQKALGDVPVARYGSAFHPHGRGAGVCGPGHQRAAFSGVPVRFCRRPHRGDGHPDGGGIFPGLRVPGGNHPPRKGGIRQKRPPQGRGRCSRPWLTA